MKHHDPAKIYGVANGGLRPKSAAAKLSELREKQRKERLDREKVLYDVELCLYHLMIHSSLSLMM